MIGQTVTLVARPQFDRYGNRIPGASTETDIDGAAVAPRGSDRRTSAESDDRGRNGVIVGMSLYLPAGVPVIDRAAQIRVAGAYGGLYEVDGEPGEWTNPFTGARRGVEVALRRAEG